MGATLPEGLPGDFAVRLVASCPEAVIYADAEGKIRFWNAAAGRIFGFAEAEALGASLDLIIPERLRARRWQGYDEVMRGRPCASRSHRAEMLAGMMPSAPSAKNRRPAPAPPSAVTVTFAWSAAKSLARVSAKNRRNGGQRAA